MKFPWLCVRPEGTATPADAGSIRCPMYLTAGGVFLVLIHMRDKLFHRVIVPVLAAQGIVGLKSGKTCNEILRAGVQALRSACISKKTAPGSNATRHNLLPLAFSGAPPER